MPSAPLSSATPARPGVLTALCIGTAFIVGHLIGGVTCSSSTIPPGSNDTLIGVRGQCVYPRSCYVVAKAGPLAGQCADCRRGGDACRLVFVPSTPDTPAPLDAGGQYVPVYGDLGISGSDDLGVRPALPSDPTAVCSFYTAPSPDLEAVCASAQTVCVARGAKCTGGVCVPAGGACASSAGVAPQRRPGSTDTATYCPFTDDVCCPSTPPATDGGVVLDGGAFDAKSGDA